MMPGKRKILFIIQSYPSERSANVLCDEKVMKCLNETGRYEIHCLTYQYDKQPLYEIVNGFYVHRFKKGPFWDVYTWARHHEGNFLAYAILLLKRLGLRIKQVLTIPIYPCYEPLFTWLYVNAAKRLHEKEQFDCVIAEHHGYDTLFAGHKLKEYDSSIRLLSVLWDPFSGKTLPKYLPRWYSNRMIEKDEQRVLKTSDAIIALKTNERYQLEHSSDKCFFKRMFFLDIPKITEPKVILSASESELSDYIWPECINIVYSGLLGLPDRDPTLLIEALGNTSFAPRIHLLFLASGEGRERAALLKDTFAGAIDIRGFVDSDYLSGILAHADFLLNFGGSNSVMIPSKLFDYMSTGLPIISTTVSDTDASVRYLRKYGNALIVEHGITADEATSRLEHFLAEAAGRRIDFSRVCDLFPDATPDAYVRIIEGVISNSGELSNN